MAEHQLPKLSTRVRFPASAPFLIFLKNAFIACFYSYKGIFAYLLVGNYFLCLVKFFPEKKTFSSQDTRRTHEIVYE